MKEFLSAFEPWVSFVTVISILGAAIGFVFGVRTYKRQMNAQLFLEFTRRYDEVMSQLPKSAAGWRFETGAKIPVASPALKKTVLRYFNLCSEEFYLWKRKYLADDIWKIWEAELIWTLESPLFRREWDTIKKEFSAFPEFVQYVEALNGASRKA